VFRDLFNASPWNLILLGRERDGEQSEYDAGEVIGEIELQLFEWLLSRLKTSFGERWWTEGIPETIRVQCVTRREQEGEGESLPPEAYLMLIDFRDIVRKHWGLCGSTMEQIAEAHGKDTATHWIVELNEMRKVWAHPIKQAFRPVEIGRFAKLRALRARISEALRKEYNDTSQNQTGRTAAEPPAQTHT
jgi:hypothetical protein